MSNQEIKNDPNKPPYQDEQEFQSTDQVVETDEDKAQANVSDEASGDGSDTQNQTGDPGRTPGSAEGDRETVEEDLENREGS